MSTAVSAQSVVGVKVAGSLEATAGYPVTSLETAVWVVLDGQRASGHLYSREMVNVLSLHGSLPTEINLTQRRTTELVICF
jgi:hypothetical protein